MKKLAYLLVVLYVITLTACGDNQKEGVMIYTLEYHLPDSLSSYAAFLPTKATVYFKGDSVVTIQGNDQESTTMITHQPTGYMLALLKSGDKRVQINYPKAEQSSELPDMNTYDLTKGSATKQIADYKAQQYIMKNKFTGDTTSTWFTHDLAVPPNFLTMVFKPELGVPLSFSTDQNGIVTKTTLKEIRFEPVPAGVFTAPAGYEMLTPQQLREMPVEN